MVFENSEVKIEEIPSVSNLVLTPIQDRYLTVIKYNHLLTAGLLAVIASIVLLVSTSLRTPVIITCMIAGVFLLIGLSYLATYLSFKNRAFAIRKHDVIYQTGWINKSVHIFPISRIQYCSVESNYFERLLSLKRVSIYTAGGDGADISIVGLEIETAEKIKEFILEKINHQDAEHES